jgi:hypothetical protein
MSMDERLIDQYKLKSSGCVLKIYSDESPESPREWDNLGIMVCSHRRYNLGDEQAKNTGDYSSWKEWCAKELPIKKLALLLPLYMMDHSGLTIRTKPFGGDYGRWDSGQIGYMYITKETVRKEYSCKRITTEILEKAKAVLQGEIEVYNQYLNGDVYGFELETAEGEHIDSCWGFYSSDIKTNGILDHAGVEFNDLTDL